MSKVKNAYKEIENIIGGPDFISDKDYMKAAYNLNLRVPRAWSLYKKIAFYLLHYIEFKYFFKEKFKN